MVPLRRSHICAAGMGGPSLLPLREKVAGDCPPDEGASQGAQRMQTVYRKYNGA